MPKITLKTLLEYKKKGQKIVCLTAYDALFAAIESQNGIDVILVGDSLGMVIQGHDTTLPVTLHHMVYHTDAVCRGNQGAFIVADMPFMSCVDEKTACQYAYALMQAGAQMVKVEGGAHLTPIIERLTLNGIPVCGHLGLLPQSINLIGSYQVHGRTPEQAEKLMRDAVKLQQAGARLLVLECVPTMLTAEITQALSIPVIGIGAGPACDGQILVVQDMLGISNLTTPKFVQNFLLQNIEGIPGAIRAYAEAVRGGLFPAEHHSFS